VREREMADAVVHIGENSPEYVAYRLLLDIMSAENKSIHGDGQKRADRDYILTTYQQCRRVVSGMDPLKK
jgi:hypothetical protein